MVRPWSSLNLTETITDDSGSVDRMTGLQPRERSAPERFSVPPGGTSSFRFETAGSVTNLGSPHHPAASSYEIGGPSAGPAPHETTSAPPRPDVSLIRTSGRYNHS